MRVNLGIDFFRIRSMANKAHGRIAVDESGPATAPPDYRLAGTEGEPAKSTVSLACEIG
jgi:hypothetical protein